MKRKRPNILEEYDIYESAKQYSNFRVEPIKIPRSYVCKKFLLELNIKKIGELLSPQFNDNLVLNYLPLPNKELKWQLTKFNHALLERAIQLGLVEVRQDKRKYEFTELGNLACAIGSPPLILALIIAEQGPLTVEELNKTEFANWDRSLRKFAINCARDKNWIVFQENYYTSVHSRESLLQVQSRDDIIYPQLLRFITNKAYKNHKRQTNFIRFGFISLIVYIKLTSEGEEILKANKKYFAEYKLTELVRDCLLEKYLQIAKRPKAIEFLLSKGANPNVNCFQRLPWKILLGQLVYTDKFFKKQAHSSKLRKQRKIDAIMTILLKYGLNPNYRHKEYKRVRVTRRDRSSYSSQQCTYLPSVFEESFKIALSRTSLHEQLNFDGLDYNVIKLCKSLLQYGADPFILLDRLLPARRPNGNFDLHRGVQQLICYTFLAHGLDPRDLFTPLENSFPNQIAMQKGYLAREKIENNIHKQSIRIFKQNKQIMKSANFNLNTWQLICAFVGPTVMYLDNQIRKHGLSEEILCLTYPD